MATLTPIEKRSLERFLKMSSGYVLTFTDRTMHEFFVDTVGRDIDDERYMYASGSKANRMRGFWQVESDLVVAKLLEALVEYEGAESPERDAVLRVITRLRQGASSEDLAALDVSVSDRTFEALANSVRAAIERDEPETGLDRLHTFMVKYMRIVCMRHGISTDREKPLHSLMGEYIKKGPALESEMTERILKSTISIFQSFHDVRNDQSLAHDNTLLARAEAHLVVGHVLGIIRFLSSVESIDPEAAAEED